MKFEAEDREFAKKFRSQEKIIQTVKVQYNFWNIIISKFVPGSFSDLIH